MNDMIRQMVQPLLDAFDTYEIKSSALQAEVDNFKSRLTAFAEEHSDIMEYYSAFAASGLQAEYTDIISKVAVSSYGAGDAADKTEADVSSDNGGSNSSAPQITVRDFLEQYRTSYDEVCKRDSVRGKAAYDELFHVADRTDDMLEAQIIIEKERLLWKIVTEDSLEIFEKKLEEMDPLFLSTTAVLLGQIKCYEESSCEEELEYRIAVQEVDNWKIITDFNCRMNVAAMLGTYIIEYLEAKKKVYEWPSDTVAQSGMSGMLKRKNDICYLVGFAGEKMGITLDDLFENPAISIWMLNARSEDEYGKRKKIINPDNLKRFREVLENEILKDINIKELLQLNY